MKKNSNFVNRLFDKAVSKMNFIRNIIFAVPVAVMVMAGVTSCGTSRGVTATAGSSGSSAGQPVAKPEHIDLSKPMAQPTEALLREADSWIGTAYRYGGNDRSGVDCSGFVVQVFDKALNIRLPRTSRQQQAYCRSIGRNELREGDLVFFTVRGGSAVGHVGIYVGNDMMIHASSSRGVIISSIATRYYIDNYCGAGRVEPYFAMLDGEKRKTAPLASAEAKIEPAPPVKMGSAPPAVVTPAQADAGDDAGSGLVELSEFFD